MTHNDHDFVLLFRMENCCDATLRYALFIFNFFVFLTGIALISVGCYIQFQMTDYLNFVDEDYLNTGVVFIVLGGVILAIGFFGCCGACTENSCMIFVFAMLLTLTVLIQVSRIMTRLGFPTQWSPSGLTLPSQAWAW